MYLTWLWYSGQIIEAHWENWNKMDSLERCQWNRASKASFYTFYRPIKQDVLAQYAELSPVGMSRWNLKSSSIAIKAR